MTTDFSTTNNHYYSFLVFATLTFPQQTIIIIISATLTSPQQTTIIIFSATLTSPQQIIIIIISATLPSPQQTIISLFSPFLSHWLLHTTDLRTETWAPDDDACQSSHQAPPTEWGVFHPASVQTRACRRWVCRFGEPSRAPVWTWPAAVDIALKVKGLPQWDLWLMWPRKLLMSSSKQFTQSHVPGYSL